MCSWYPLGRDYGKPEVFVDGRVDAAFVVEPQLTRGEHDGFLRVIDRVAEYYPRYQWGIILADERWLRREAELAARLLHAFRQACRSIKARPADTVALGSRIFGVSPGVFEAALQRDLSRWQTDARLDTAGLQAALGVQAEMGLLTTSLRVDEMVLQL